MKLGLIELLQRHPAAKHPETSGRRSLVLLTGSWLATAGALLLGSSGDFPAFMNLLDPAVAPKQPLRLEQYVDLGTALILAGTAVYLAMSPLRWLNQLIIKALLQLLPGGPESRQYTDHSGHRQEAD